MSFCSMKAGYENRPWTIKNKNGAIVLYDSLNSAKFTLPENSTSNNVSLQLLDDGVLTLFDAESSKPIWTSNVNSNNDVNSDESEYQSSDF